MKKSPIRQEPDRAWLALGPKALDCTDSWHDKLQVVEAYPEDYEAVKERAMRELNTGLPKGA